MESVAIKNVLVTGSEGYIGVPLINKLLSKGYSVLGLDTNFYQHINLGETSNSYKLIKKDMRDIEDLDLSSVDAVIHLAALSNDPIGELDPNLTLDINHTATINLAKKAKSAGVKRFLFSSSCSIYGITESGIVDETSEPNPLTAYAKSKILSEKDLTSLADKDFCVGLLRNSTVYGYSPRFRNDLVVNSFATCAVATKKIKVMSDGTPWRPLIDVRDLSNIFLAFLEADSNLINCELFNIGFNENNFQVKDILEKIHHAMPECEIIFTGEHGADTRSYKVKFDKFKNAFPNYRQEWNLDKSIDDLIAQLKAYQYSEKDFQNGVYTRIQTLKDLMQEKKINDKLFWINS